MAYRIDRPFGGFIDGGKFFEQNVVIRLAQRIELIVVLLSLVTNLFNKFITKLLQLINTALARLFSMIYQSISIQETISTIGFEEAQG